MLLLDVNDQLIIHCNDSPTMLNIVEWHEYSVFDSHLLFDKENLDLFWKLL